jgi:hypothetical protein
LAALDMVNATPVLISGQSFDLRVLGGTLLNFTQSTGSMAITNVDNLGGTFTSTLPVAAELIFTPIGGGSPITSTFSDTFTPVVPGIWSAVARGDDPHNSAFPAGGFFPGVDSESEHGKVLTQEQAMLAAHGVLPGQIPEPSAWIMYFTAGLIVPAYAQWRRRRA